MNKLLRYFLIIFLIFSPFWVGAFLTMNEPPDSVAGLAVLLIGIIGTPIIAVCGFIFSLLTRKKINAAKLSLIGYLVPAIFVCVLFYL